VGHADSSGGAARRRFGVASPVGRRALAHRVEHAVRAAAAAGDRRSPIPNLVAVNFYRRGEALRAVNALNGIA
jgi:hypothetical protein